MCAEIHQKYLPKGMKLFTYLEGHGTCILAVHKLDTCLSSSLGPILDLRVFSVPYHGSRIFRV